jgi:hypothetical protein
VRTLAEQDAEPLLAEAARWVLAAAGPGPDREAPATGRGLHRQKGRPARRAGPGEHRADETGALMEGGDGMEGMEGVGGVQGLGMAPSTPPSMAHIEMVVFLQGVDLLAYCNAEQVVRLAGIASEIRFGQGQVIYRRNDPPDALYCIVEGRVALAGDTTGRDQAGPRETFGVTDILSGQLRSCDATAAEPTRVLAIEAEDFFDLLSNNIEIVKALFRRLAHHGTGGPDPVPETAGARQAGKDGKE